MEKYYIVTDNDDTIVGVHVVVSTLLEEIQVDGVYIDVLMTDELPPFLAGRKILGGTKNEAGEYTDIVVVIRDDVNQSEFDALRVSTLSSSDWTQLQNSPLTTEQIDEAATWRQVIRDIPGEWADPLMRLNKLKIQIDNRPSFIKVI